MNLSVSILRSIIINAIAGMQFAKEITTPHSDRVVSIAIVRDPADDDGVVVNLDYALRTGKRKGATWSRELFIDGESQGLFPVNTPDNANSEEEIEALKLNVMFARRKIKQAIIAAGYWSTRVSRGKTMEEWSRPAPVVVDAPVATAPVAESAPAPTVTEQATAPATVSEQSSDVGAGEPATEEAAAPSPATETLHESIEELAIGAANAESADDALKYAQAASVLAQTLAILSSFRQ